MNPKDAVGIKKAPLNLVPPALLIAAASALRDGGAKYGPYNWRDQPVQASIYYAATLRHLSAWFDGEDIAEDSGVDHLAHAVACLAIIIDCKSIDGLIDDRPTHGAAAKMLKEQDRS